MTYECNISGVCAKKVVFDMEDGVLNNVKFIGGCPGNTLGVAALCNGRKAEDVIATIKGIRCGFKPTSCPDQLACAIEAAIAQG